MDNTTFILVLKNFFYLIFIQALSNLYLKTCLYVGELWALLASFRLRN